MAKKLTQAEIDQLGLTSTIKQYRDSIKAAEDELNSERFKQVFKNPTSQAAMRFHQAKQSRLMEIASYKEQMVYYYRLLKNEDESPESEARAVAFAETIGEVTRPRGWMAPPVPRREPAYVTLHFRVAGDRRFGRAVVDEVRGINVNPPGTVTIQAVADVHAPDGPAAPEHRHDGEFDMDEEMQAFAREEAENAELEAVAARARTAGFAGWRANLNPPDEDAERLAAGLMAAANENGDIEIDANGDIRIRRPAPLFVPQQAPQPEPENADGG